LEKRLSKIPPFQDAHIHFMADGQPVTLKDCQFISQQFLSQGIFLVADMGHKTGLGLEFRKSSDRIGSLPIKIRSAGLALHKKGGYGGFLGKGVSGKEEIKSTIQALNEAGVDFIKIVNSGIVSLDEGKPVTRGGFSDEEWRVIQEEAGAHGLPIRCHANSDQAIRQAVDFGASSIEHGFFIGEETLQAMAEREVSWTPTAFALLSLKPFLPEDKQYNLNRIMDQHLKTINLAAAIGVRLQIGTDSGSKGVRPGESFFKELQLFRKAGLNLEQILAVACLDQAEMEEGNYLLVEDNFIKLGRIEAVYFKGFLK